MHVFEFAMQMEEDGRDYYLKLAETAELPGLKTIFTSLAEDERKHFEIFRSLKHGRTMPDIPESTALETAQSVFASLPRGADALKGMTGLLEAYRHAMQLEVESFRCYEEAAARETDAGVRNVLLLVAKEEHRHFNILDNVYNFVNAPNQYLEWGEFSNLGDFHQFGRDTED